MLSVKQPVVGVAGVKDAADVAYQVKCTLEEKIGKKFEEYKPLIYRQNPYTPYQPIEVYDACFLIKVETIPEKQSIHIFVHVHTDQNLKTTYTLVSYHVDLDLHAPLDKLYVIGPGGGTRP